MEAFRVQSPPSFEVGGTGQVVDNRVYVGANSQTIKSDVVSDITNICECCWIIGIVDATSQSCSPCTSAYQTNHDGSPIICCTRLKSGFLHPYSACYREITTR